MKNLFLRACIVAFAFLAMPAVAQHATTSQAPDGFAREVTTITVAATSIGQRGTATSSGVTPTSGTASFTGGVATIGPLVPQLARPVHVRLFGTWTGTAYVGTSADACATITPLTVGGATWGSFTANANEDVDIPYRSGVSECLVATVTSGTLTYSLDQ